MSIPDTLQDVARARLEYLRRPLESTLDDVSWGAPYEVFPAMQRFWQRYGNVENVLRMTFPLQPWDDENTPRGEPSFKWSGTNIESNTRMLRWADPTTLEAALTRLVEQALRRLQAVDRA